MGPSLRREAFKALLRIFYDFSQKCNTDTFKKNEEAARGSGALVHLFH